MILAAETRVEAPPEDVFAFFERINEQYLAWHPNHITFRWKSGDGLAEGSEAYFAEEIAGDLKQQTIRYSVVE